MTITEIRNKNHGYIRKEDLPHIIKHNRLEMLLVRCGGCRFLAPAQDVEHLIGIIDREKSDYVRDVSFPTRR